MSESCDNCGDFIFNKKSTQKYCRNCANAIRIGYMKAFNKTAWKLKLLKRRLAKYE